MEFASGVHQALGRLSQRRSDPCQGRDLVAAQGISGLLQSLRGLDEGSNLWRLSPFPFLLRQHEPYLLWPEIGSAEEGKDLPGPSKRTSCAPGNSLATRPGTPTCGSAGARARAGAHASWASGLDADDVAAIYRRFAPGQSLADDFRGCFGQELGEDALNQSHQIVVVAATLDDSTERIIGYLAERGIAINALLFQVFAHGDEKLTAALGSSTRFARRSGPPRRPTNDPSEPWDAEFCGSFGHEVPYAVHTGPLHAGPALSGVRGLLQDLVPFSGGSDVFRVRLSLRGELDPPPEGPPPSVGTRTARPEAAARVVEETPLGAPCASTTKGKEATRKEASATHDPSG